jgi:hypothetical protein
MDNDSIQKESLPCGDSVEITHNNGITQCFYISQDNKILLCEIEGLKQTTKIYPTNTRNISGSFLEPKYNIVFLFEGYDVDIEEYVSDEKMYIISGLPEMFIKTLRYGLGLKKEYKYIAEITNYLKECRIIVVSNIRKTCIDGANLVINGSDLEKVRNGIDRIYSLYSNESLQSRRLFVYNELLHNIDNNRFPEKKKRIKKILFTELLKIPILVNQYQN